MDRAQQIEALLRTAAQLWDDDAHPLSDIADERYEIGPFLWLAEAVYREVHPEIEKESSPWMPAIPNGMHVVYRAYTRDGELLYVGATSAFRERMRDHHLHSRWWSHAAGINVEAFSLRKDAFRHESEVIADDRPMFNVMGNRCE